MTVTGTENYVTTYTYDLNNRLLTEAKNTSGIVKTSRYTYDANGNQLKKSSSALDEEWNTYDSFNRLVSSAQNGTIAVYAYKADGLRLSKTVGECIVADLSTLKITPGGSLTGVIRNPIKTTHVWDGSFIVLELNASNAVVDKYVRGVNLVKSNRYGYYVYNAHGDVIQLTSTGGSVTKNYLYDAFGVEVSPVSSDANPFRYCGEYFDSSNGTYYLRNRYYYASIARFTSEDPIRNGLNWYTYCANNPIFYVDPLGLAEVVARAYAEGKGATVTWTGNDTVGKTTYANATVTYNGQTITIRGEIKNGNLMIDDSAFSKLWTVSSGSTAPYSVKVGSNNLLVTGPTASGQFKDGIFFGSGSASAGYGEANARLQVGSNSTSTSGLLGVYAKASAGNAQGKIGVGNSDVSASLKGVGDVLTATGQAGIQYKNGIGVVASATASAVSGRATVEFGIFGWQVELGVSGYAGGIGAAAKVGYFPDDGFIAKVEAIAGVGGGLIIRVKP